MQDFLAVQDTVRKLFIYPDEGNWDGMSNEVFATEVFLDYSSFGGGHPEKKGCSEIIEEWSAFFDRMEYTHHQLGNELIEVDGETATAFTYVTAGHYKTNDSGNNLWTVVGTYDIKLEKRTSGWKIIEMKFNYKYQFGNADIPNMK